MDATAEKHYGKNSVDIFEEITKKLDGQNRDPDEYNSQEEALYHLTSCTTYCVGNKQLNYRDTIFKVHPASNEIHYFHGSPRNKKQFDNFPSEWKE